MARSPLFESLRQAVRIAALAARDRPGVPPVDELIDLAVSRRRFLRDAAIAGAGLAAAACSREPSAPAGAPRGSAPAPGGLRIAIVGGGMAGLNTAWKLQKAGLSSTIFEAADRTGGRMFTASNLLADGLTTELGGEFIDSTHEEMLALMDEFQLERLDTRGPGLGSLKAETYFVNGRHYSLEQAARAFVPFAKQVLADSDSMEEVVNYEKEGGGAAFDKLSIAEYFDRLGVRGWLRELLEVAYVTEYGLDAGDQSALNFIFLIGSGDLADRDAFALLGESDERYKVRGGNQRLVDELAKRLEPQIRRRHRLEAIRSRGDGYTLTFETSGGVVDQDADLVVMTVPFTLLREVKVQVDLPPLKQKVINELGYGANAKVLVGFESRVWQKLGYTGSTYSDEPFQLAWDNSFMQPGTAGGLTLYSGGKPALDAGEGTAEEAAARLMRGIERAYPGATRARNGKVSRFHWPTFPWVKGSYSCYRPGQWTTIAGAEGLPVGNLFFAGEHCSYDFQGYMNGAAQSGADTARAVMARASGSAAWRRRLARTA